MRNRQNKQKIYMYSLKNKIEKNQEQKCNHMSPLNDAIYLICGPAKKRNHIYVFVIKFNRKIPEQKHIIIHLLCNVRYFTCEPAKKKIINLYFLKKQNRKHTRKQKQ